MKEHTLLISTAMSASLGKAFGRKATHFTFTSNAHQTLPGISVPEIKKGRRNMSSSERRTPRVHLIIGRDVGSESKGAASSAQNIHQEVIDTLQETFSVRIRYKQGRGSKRSSVSEYVSMRSKSSQQLAIAKSHVCVYLFSKATLEDANCFHELCTAISLKLPLVYVKYQGEELLHTFAECIQRNSYGCTSLKGYIERYVLDKLEPPTLVPQGKKTAKPNNRLAPLAVRIRPMSTSDLNVRGVVIPKSKHKDTRDDDGDVLLYLIKEFKAACVFDASDRLHSSDRLKQSIYTAVGIKFDTHSAFTSNVIENMDCSSQSDFVLENSNKDENTHLKETDNLSDEIVQEVHLRVPESEKMVCTREWDSSSCSGSVSAPPHMNLSKDGRFSYDFHMTSPIQLEEKATTYLIFQEKTKPGPEIRRINYPVEIEKLTETCDDLESDEYDPCVSPIHIPDIDLARDVTKVLDNADNDL